MTAPSLTALRLDVTDGIAVVTFDLPGSRANTLGQAVWGELEAVLADLAARRDVNGLIFRSGKPGMFIAGADLREMGAVRPDDDTLRRVIRRGLDVIAGFEQLPYPTVAAIDGSCLGGGLEVALGFDYRLASSNHRTELGLPETRIGLIPGWGGTQRLPRLVGPSLAVEMICTGEPAHAERARQIGLAWDVVPVERLDAEALALVRWTATHGGWQEARRRKQQPVGLSEEQAAFTFAVARAQVQAKAGGQYPAPPAALTAIEQGCNLPLEDGLRFETEQFLRLVGGSVSRNLIAVFFMKQRLSKDTGVADASVKPLPVHQVGVIGAGLMGSGIAGAHVRRGVPAVMLDTTAQAIEKGVAAISKSCFGRVEIGRMSAAEAGAALARLSTSLTYGALTDRDVVIEAIVENEKVKTGLFSELQKVLRPGTILASNTSTISITRMAEATADPARFVGMHFFNPVDRMALVEVIRGAKTSDETVATLVALARRIGKTPIVVRDCPGFLVNRILFPYMNEALVLLEEGVPPRHIDRAATAFGMPMGPITLHDVVGLDTAVYAGHVLSTAFPDKAMRTTILDRLVAAGRLGQKSGAGFYAYPKGHRGADDPALDEFLTAAHRPTGKADLSLEQITERLFLLMLNEAAHALADGIVREPGDVDMGLILGIGYPPFRGGILRWADEVGLPVVVEKLKQYEPLGSRFQPHELLRSLAASGRSFYPG